MKILLWEIRNRYNISLNKLSRQTGISKSTLQRIETGATSPTLDKLELIAKAMKIKITDLFDSDYK